MGEGVIVMIVLVVTDGVDVGLVDCVGVGVGDRVLLVEVVSEEVIDVEMVNGDVVEDVGVNEIV